MRKMAVWRSRHIDLAGSLPDTAWGFVPNSIPRSIHLRNAVTAPLLLDPADGYDYLPDLVEDFEPEDDEVLTEVAACESALSQRDSTGLRVRLDHDSAHLLGDGLDGVEGRGESTRLHLRYNGLFGTQQFCQSSLA